MGGENKGQSPGGKKRKDRCKEELGSYDEWKKTRRARRGMGQKRRNLKDGKIKYENAMGKRGVRELAMDMRHGKGSGGEWKGKESTGKRRDRRKIGARDRGDGIAHENEYGACEVCAFEARLGSASSTDAPPAEGPQGAIKGGNVDDEIHEGGRVECTAFALELGTDAPRDGVSSVQCTTTVWRGATTVLGVKSPDINRTTSRHSCDSAHPKTHHQGTSGVLKQLRAEWQVYVMEYWWMGAKKKALI
ncbi:hypothetical protein C8J57DRAFT_1254897 [Mycena rebaudengoi]|nr:hypothetical protein C8J57DRAFT_1254897 [Mycena rebaudengoi]